MGPQTVIPSMERVSGVRMGGLEVTVNIIATFKTAKLVYTRVTACSVKNARMGTIQLLNVESRNVNLVWIGTASQIVVQ